MSKLKLIPLAVEKEGLLFATAYAKAEGKVWLWLTSAMVQILNRDCPRAWEYQLRDPELSSIECRYPRALLGYVDNDCGRRRKGGILNEDVFVDALALHTLLGDTRTSWPNTVGLRAVSELVQLAASFSLKIAQSRAKFGRPS